ncbi:hypothetical protein PG994_012763 [Apiospora phragmitis]|uniref:Fungal N-terminal domain-containing protein n=1 Tax=Apiospora phragmitis TaxID=2905665 RepID=A0ABR1TD91_9PEZI
MDPFAAIGFVSSIITFLDFGAKIVKTAKEIHTSASGASKDNADLKDLTKSMEKSMETLALDLKPPDGPANMTASEKALAEVCTECGGLTTDLLKDLNDIKPHNSNSKHSSLAATFRNFRNKSKVKELDLKLDNPWSPLMALVLIGRRHEVDQRLDDILKAGNIHESELRSLRRNTEALRSGITVKTLEPSAIEQLRLLLALSDEAIEKAAQALVLKHLEDKNMDLRFSDIHRAHTKTLSWIYDGLDESLRSTWDPYSKHRISEATFDTMAMARSDYISWLNSRLNNDKAIFHICGKPGAGKSTLVKYLCTHEATMNGLREWAAGKNLVVCKYCAWQPGIAIQNTIKAF